MSSFEANLKTMPFAEQTILLRVFNSKDELMAILPNFPAKQGTLRVFSHVASTTGQIGRDEANEALRIFASTPSVHNKIQVFIRSWIFSSIFVMGTF